MPGSLDQTTQLCTQLVHHLDLSVSAGACLDAMQTAPTPVTWARTCRTKQSRSLCPGWRLAEAEESKTNSSLNMRRFRLTLCYYMFHKLYSSIFLVMLLNSPNKKLCWPSMVKGKFVKMPKGTVCLKWVLIINAMWLFYFIKHSHHNSFCSHFGCLHFPSHIKCVRIC